MKKVISFVLLIFLLASCWTDENAQENIPWESPDNIQNSEKWEWTWKKSWTWTIDKSDWQKVSSNDFLIETKTISDFNNSIYIEKVWQIISDQTIDLKSQISGRLSTVYVKEWDEVYKGQHLAKVTDTYSKYYLDLEKAQIDYEKQIINKESQLVTLEKNITNAEISLNDAKQNYENAKITAEEDIKKAKLDYENSDLVDISSQAYLELDKAKLDYDNTLNSNKQTINTHINNVKKEYNSLVIDLTDIIKFSDELLWVTTENEDENDSFEDYLGAKNNASLVDAENSLRELINYKKDIEGLDISSITEENLVEFMDSYFDWYDKINVLLSYIEDVLNNSISSVWSLSDSDINSYISQVNSYQNWNQWNISSFTQTKSSINSFLNTYKNSELSALKNVELQELKLED